MIGERSLEVTLVKTGKRLQWVGLRPSIKVRYPTWGESSDVSMLGQFKRIINLDTEVSDGALQFGVA